MHGKSHFSFKSNFAQMTAQMNEGEMRASVAQMIARIKDGLVRTETVRSGSQ